MFKRFVIIVAAVCCLLSVVSCDSSAVKETPFKVGDVYYQSLQAACDAAIQAMSTSSTDSEIIVEIVKDASGPGISVSAGASSSLPTSLIIDFGSNSYTVTGTKAASNADFDISGVVLVLLGNEGKLIGSGATLCSLANNSYLAIGDSLKVEAADGSYFAVAGKGCDIYIDSYFDGSVKGNIKLDSGDLFIYSEEGSIDIGKLELAGSGSQLVFDAVRKTDNTEIDEITIDSQAEACIPITTSEVFEAEEYDEIDKVLEKSGKKVHRHTFRDAPDEVYLEATCCSNRYDEFKCTNPNCEYVDTREVEGTKDYSKHNLVHVNYVAPTATTSGIEECEQCEWCCQYFAPTKSVGIINPILLATDNVPYADMQAGGIESLNAYVQALADELDGTETKGKVSTAANVLSAIFTAISAADRLEDTTAEDVQKILSDLQTINLELNKIDAAIKNLMSEIEKNDLYSYFNSRYSKLNELYFATDPYYASVIEILNRKGSEQEIAKVVNRWYEQDKRILSEPAVLLDEALGIKAPSGLNLFQIYDYVGRSSMGWEHLSIEYRVAMRAFEMNTMLEGYKMVDWYFKYCYTTDDAYRKKSLSELKTAWENYKKFCEDKDNMMMTNQNQVIRWLYNSEGESKSFNPTLKIADYEHILEKNKENYRISCKREEETKESIDNLLSEAGGEAFTYNYFQQIRAWYGKDSKNEKSIYEILEELGFKDADGTALSKYLDAKKYIIVFNGKEGFRTFDGKKRYHETAYKTITFAQDFKENGVDWIGSDALSATGIAEKTRIYTGCEFFHEGHIYSLGNPSGNKFYNLKEEKFDPKPYVEE